MIQEGMTMLSVLTLNIGATAPERARQILEWLAARPEDVFILTETSAGPGTSYLLGQFRRAGYDTVKTPDTGGERGTALISRVPLGSDLTPGLAAVTIPCRVAAAVLKTDPAIAVIGVYVPSRDRSAAKTERKQNFISSLLAALDTLPPDLTRNAIVGGDYNVIGRDHRPLHPGFLPFEFGLLVGLRERGLADAYEFLSPGAQAHSWIGRTGDGYRYDYLHTGPGLNGLAVSCEYLHETRGLKLSDHAAMTLTLRADADRIDHGNPATAGEYSAPTLF